MTDDTGADGGAPGDTTPVITPEVDTAKQEAEGRARRMGWRPKDEFRGDQTRWTDADTFIARGEAELPILRDRYRNLDERFVRQGDELKEVNTRIGEMTSAFKEHVGLARKAEERAFDRAKREIQTKMRSAVEMADKPAFQQAEAELEQLEQTRPVPPTTPVKDTTEKKTPEAAKAPSLDPAVQSWLSENTWMNTDPEMAAVAGALHARMLQTEPHLSMSENLARVKVTIAKRYPEHFGNHKREESAAVSTPTGSTKTTKPAAKTFDALPAEAKAAYAKYKIMMPEYKSEDYAKVYFAGDE